MINIQVNGSGEKGSTTYTSVVLKPGNLTQEMFDSSGGTKYKYIIKWNYNLGDSTITLPEGSIIEFDGGNITNGTLIGNNTKILNLNKIDFDESLNLEGTWNYIDYRHKVMTEKEYDNLKDKNNDTIYFIIEE